MNFTTYARECRKMGSLVAHAQENGRMDTVEEITTANVELQERYLKARRDATVAENATALLDKMKRKAEGRITAKWQTLADVDWDDLEHHIDVCKTRPSEATFDTVIRIVEALKNQVMTR